jgi:hypothetical protein
MIFAFPLFSPGNCPGNSLGNSPGKIFKLHDGNILEQENNCIQQINLQGRPIGIDLKNKWYIMLKVQKHEVVSRSHRKFSILYIKGAQV